MIVVFISDNTWDSENPVTAGKPVSEVFQLIRSYFHFGILFDLSGLPSLLNS